MLFAVIGYFPEVLVLVIQAFLPVRVARRRPQWSRRKVAFLTALVGPAFYAVNLMIFPWVIINPDFYGWHFFATDFGIQSVRNSLMMAVFAWLFGVVVAWAVLAWKRLPMPPSDVAKTFE